MKAFKLRLILLCLMTTVTFFFGCDEENTDPVPQGYIDMAPGEVNEDTDNVRLVFGGDVMLARKVEDKVVSNGNGNYVYPFLPIQSYLTQADITFVNLEGVISDLGYYDLTKFPSGPWFKFNLASIDGLVAAGIDVVSVANNHTFDFGRIAFEDCLSRLTAAGIKYCGGGFSGEEAYAPLFVESKGVKIAFLGYTNHGTSVYRALTEWSSKELPYYQQNARSGICWLYIKWLERGIYAARDQNADIIVVSMHFGEDYSKTPSSAQDRYAHLAIDRGANLVIGHSPKVTQPIVKYQDGYIAYSLGNLVYDKRESAQAGITKGCLFEVNINKNSKKISNVNALDTIIDEGTWQVRFAD